MSYQTEYFGRAFGSRIGKSREYLLPGKIEEVWKQIRSVLSFQDGEKTFEIKTQDIGIDEDGLPELYDGEDAGSHKQTEKTTTLRWG